jgi:sulfate adenylyltransferase subunit 1 (EFTu-like GTPase family)
LKEAFAAMAVTLTVTDEIDISRGDMLIGRQQTSPSIADKFKATIVWMTEQAMTPGRQYLIKLATHSVSGSVSLIHHRIDVNTLEHHDASELKLNEIGCCTVAVNAPVVFDPYKLNKSTGSFIIIDRLSNVTVGAGMISGEANIDDWSPVTAAERATRFGQTASIIALNGHQAQQIAYQLERKLFDTGHAASILEQADTTLTTAIKQAGLLCLTVNATNIATDVLFNTDDLSVDEIYEALKHRGIIH